GYQAIEAPHQEVHKYGKLATEYAKSGDRKNGISSIARMEEASLQVLSRLEELARSGESDAKLLCASDH
ncbi:MAG: chemotaxis protein, partial [Candidatus Thiodiazotropha sp.]